MPIQQRRQHAKTGHVAGGKQQRGGQADKFGQLDLQPATETQGAADDGVVVVPAAIAQQAADAAEAREANEAGKAGALAKDVLAATEDEEVQAAARDLLSNPVIEDFEVRVP